jgi:hypothetical protein
MPSKLKFGSPAWRKKYAAKAKRNRKAKSKNPKNAASVLKKIKALLK